MRSLAEAVGAALGERVVASSPVHGGDTASAHRMELASGRRVFAKTHAAPPPGFFTTEAAGLRWLADAGAVASPRCWPIPPGWLRWAGRRLVDRAGRSWLIDPAAHGGHREFDLAMMRLFGGFGEDCFAAWS